MSDYDFTGFKVLFVDDSQVIRKSGEVFLSKAKVEVILADNGYEALSILDENLPNLIFLDVMMPRLDGFQTCQMIKSNPALRNIPIIMLSAKDSLFDQAKGRLVGATEYITKPFQRDELLEKVNFYFQNQKS